MIKQISNKIFNYFIQKLIKWFIRFLRFFHENYSINQATNKSKISVMENKRLSTIASLTKLIKCCEVFFNGCRACVLTLKNVCFQSKLVFTLLVNLVVRKEIAMCWGISVQKEGGWLPFLKIIQKEQNKIWTRNYPVGFFLCPMQLSSFCVGQHLFKTYGNFFCP
jgi:hypothetical protein